MQERVECIFLGGIFDDHSRDTIIANSIGPIQNAADVFQKALLKGLMSVARVSIVNLPFVGSFPRRYRKPFFVGSRPNLYDGSECRAPSFLNITGVKLISRAISASLALRSLIKSRKRNGGKVVIIIYSMNISFLGAGLLHRLLLGRAGSVCIVIPDLPLYMSGNASALQKALRLGNNAICTFLCRFVDSFVLLTKQMADRLPIEKRPYIVVEGAYGGYCEPVPKFSSRENAFLYTGTLDNRYGLGALLRGFIGADLGDWQLWICGDGPDRASVEAACKSHSSIRFLGQVAHAKSIALQRRVKYVVNPRSPDGEFTKYSFPSKIIEYFASGSVTLMYRLEGVPDEYYKYCLIIDDCGIASSMTRATQISESEFNIMADGAREFILTEKNAEAQGRAIFDLVSRSFDGRDCVQG